MIRLRARTAPTPRSSSPESPMTLVSVLTFFKGLVQITVFNVTGSACHCANHLGLAQRVFSRDFLMFCQASQRAMRIGMARRVEPEVLPRFEPCPLRQGDPCQWPSPHERFIGRSILTNGAKTVKPGFSPADGESGQNGRSVRFQGLATPGKKPRANPRPCRLPWYPEPVRRLDFFDPDSSLSLSVQW